MNPLLVALAIFMFVLVVALILFVTLDIIDRWFRPDRADSRFKTPGDRFYEWLTKRRDQK